MRKWSRFSLGCNACNNYLRKHGDGRARFTLDPRATASLLACVAAAGLEYNFPALSNSDIPCPFLPRSSWEPVPDPTRHVGVFFFPLVLKCWIKQLETRILGS